MEVKSKRLNKKGELKMLNLLGGSLLILVFSLSLITFTVQSHTENNSSHQILEDSEFVAFNDSLTDRIGESSNNFSNTNTGFFSDVPFLQEVEAVVTAIFGVVPSFITQTTATFNLVMGFISDRLNLPGYILNAITGFLLVAGILLGWRVYKAGS